MNTTGTVLYVRADRAAGGGPRALEGEYEVVVAEGAIDAIKRLSRERPLLDCVVVPAAIVDLSLRSFLSRVEATDPETAVVVVGPLPSDAEVAAALVDADAYVPDGRESTLVDRVRRLLESRRVDRALGEQDRLAGTLGRVAVAVAGAGDRPAIESAVYDEFVGSSGFRHVWIARPDDGALDVRVPVTGRLGEDELGELVGGGDPDFARRAVEGGQVAATEGRVPTRSASASTSPATVRDGGETRALASAAVPFVHDGRVLGVAIVSTERRDAFDGSERAALSDIGAVVGHGLWAAEKAEGTGGKEMGRGMENLVHDLRNPLGIARSHLEFVREDGEEASLERIASALDRMEETIDRVAAGVAGEREAAAVETDLGDAARTAWESIETDEATIALESAPPIRADRDLLVRLLSNLFQNAVSHAGPSATVRVGTTRDGFFVDDDGPGIPPADRESVFDRGYSTSSDGLGIGLSIVEDVATAHGWEVSVDESEAGGARFEFTGVEVADGERVDENETA